VRRLAASVLGATTRTSSPASSSPWTPAGQALLGRQENAGGVERARARAGRQVRAPSGARAPLEAGPRAPHAVERVGEGQLGEGVGDAESDLARDARVVCRERAEVARGREDAPAVLGGPRARGGRRERAAAVDEGRPDGALQPLDAAGDRRLREVQPARGGADRAGVHDRDERPHVIDVRVEHIHYPDYSLAARARPTLPVGTEPAPSRLAARGGRREMNPMTSGIVVERVQESRLPSVDLSSVDFSAVMSDHMLVAEFRDGPWGAPAIRP
jgi:hypothetical protein